MEQKSFKLWNRIVGWAVFLIAATVYLLTIEPSSSLWDCGEFIATSYKLEVGHPPGAPLFMLLARIATMFAPSPHYVPHMVNGMNALASAFCILFLFWSITHIARRMMTRDGNSLTMANAIAILGAGAVGALAYTFTDTFWFSAVEGEVYAMSSMFTALVVWLMLRWEEEADEPSAWRWIILIAYMMGLSIGVHILNLLTIPALVLIFYFRKFNKITLPGLCLATLIACVILLIVHGIIIPYTVYIGAMIDVFCVNKLSLPVNTGIIIFAFVLFILLGILIYITHYNGTRTSGSVWKYFNLSVVCITMIMLGFSSYASVSIRASVNPPMNSNNPDNPTALLSMLNREQYGNHPLIYGPSYAAPATDYVEKKIYTYNTEKKKYEKSSTVVDYVYPDEFMHYFPRMWNYAKTENEYKAWAACRSKTERVRDENGQIVEQEVPVYGKTIRYGGENYTVPTASENLKYFFSYQLQYMYWRYFLWNFVGRQDDIQADDSTITHGNWMSGIDAIDENIIGPQDNLPREMAENRARNTYFFLPFLLGLIGLVYQLIRDPRNFVVVLSLFVMMGIALVVYFNSAPGEVRERDYVYAGSFYAFSMWIGLGVLALYHFVKWIFKGKFQKVAAACSVVVAMAVPGILCAENWDDHDRSHRTMARDLGYNYLSSVVEKEGVSPIIVNYGDNDTFPLWFNQEVDGVRTDVRIMNSSYLGGAWYVDEMKCKANDAEGIPFSLPSHKYTNVNDAIPVLPKVDRVVDAKEVMDFIGSDDRNTKEDSYVGLTDYVPAINIAIPVDKEAAIASGIVAEKDRDLMVDTVYISLKQRSLTRSDFMLLDMFAHFDWKRPIYFTQVSMLQNFGLLDYLQFDGYAYRFVPIFTPYEDSWSIGRIDAGYAYDKLMNTFRYGNLADPRVYVDEFTQYNLKVARTREAFARVAREYIKIADDETLRSKEGISREECLSRAEKLLDRGLEVLPVNQIRFTEANTYPFIECYYDLGLNDKADKLLEMYYDNIIEHIEYYLQFEGVQGSMVMGIIDNRILEMEQLYNLAIANNREPIIRNMNQYFRSLGVSDEALFLTSQEKEAAAAV